MIASEQTRESEHQKELIRVSCVHWLRMQNTCYAPVVYGSVNLFLWLCSSCARSHSHSRAYPNHARVHGKCYFKIMGQQTGGLRTLVADPWL